MSTDLLVMMEDRPGALAELGAALGRAGVNLGGACAITSRGQGMIHLLVEGDVDAARAAITDAGIEVREEREVLVVDVHDEPGMLGSHAQWLTDIGVNIELLYLATGTRLVFGVDDIAAARASLA